MKIELTKAEIRHAYNNDPIFLWLRESINAEFNYEANLLGATTAERLFEIRGQAQVLKYFNDIDRLLARLDLEETDG